MPITAQKDAPALKQAELALAGAYQHINDARSRARDYINAAKVKLATAMSMVEEAQAELDVTIENVRSTLDQAKSSLDPIHAAIQQAHYVSDDKERAVAIVEAIIEIGNTYKKQTAQQVQNNGPTVTEDEDEDEEPDVDEDEPEEDEEVFVPADLAQEAFPPVTPPTAEQEKPWRHLNIPLTIECYSSGDSFDPLEKGWTDDDQCWFKDLSTLIAYHGSDYKPSMPDFLWDIDDSLDLMCDRTAEEIQGISLNASWRHLWVEYAISHGIFAAGEIEPTPKRKVA